MEMQLVIFFFFEKKKKQGRACGILIRDFEGPDKL